MDLFQLIFVPLMKYRLFLSLRDKFHSYSINKTLYPNYQLAIFYKINDYFMNQNNIMNITLLQIHYIDKI